LEEKSLIFKLKQNFVGWKDYDEFGLYDGKRKTFEDNFAPSLVSLFALCISIV